MTESRRARSRARIPEMVPVDRVRAAVAGEQVDRVPFCVWHHFQPRADPRRFVRQTLDFFVGHDLDICKVMPDIPYPFPDDSIRKPEDWYLLGDTDPYDSTFGRQLEAIALLADQISGDTPILVTLFSPLTYAMRFAGREALRTHIEQHPVELHAGLTAIARNLARFSQAAIDGGADGIFLAVQGAGDRQLSAPEYGEFARPYELQVMRAALDGWLTTLHVHAASDLDITPFLSYGAPVLSWSDRLTGISLRQVREQAPDLCLMGGLSERGPLLDGSPDDLLAEMRDALHQVGGRRFILANGCSIPDETPNDRVRLARRLVDQLPAPK
jgi:uroporphyrinogen decarboxylase